MLGRGGCISLPRKARPRDELLELLEETSADQPLLAIVFITMKSL
jgi:hypothetical protein